MPDGNTITADETPQSIQPEEPQKEEKKKGWLSTIKDRIKPGRTTGNEDAGKSSDDQNKIDQKENEIAEQIRIDTAKEYINQWGLDRLDSLAKYYKENLKNLPHINEDDRKDWMTAIENYQKNRDKFDQEIQSATDPITKANLLKSIAFDIIFFYPSEIEKIFDTEQDPKRGLVNPDSLLEKSQIMLETLSGKEYTERFPSNSASYTVAPRGSEAMLRRRYTSANRREGMRLLTRMGALNQLEYEKEEKPNVMQMPEPEKITRFPTVSRPNNSSS